MNIQESLLHAELEIELLKNKQIALENKIDYLIRIVESTDIRYDIEILAEENERLKQKLLANNIIMEAIKEELTNIVETKNTFYQEFAKNFYEDKKKRKELENQLAKSLES
jgi:hypothetical protein